MWWIIIWLLKENSGRYEFWNSETLAQFPRATELRYRNLPLHPPIFFSPFRLSSSKFSRCTLWLLLPMSQCPNLPTFVVAFKPRPHNGYSDSESIYFPRGFRILGTFLFLSLSLSFSLSLSHPPWTWNKSSSILVLQKFFSIIKCFSAETEFDAISLFRAKRNRETYIEILSNEM